MAITVAGLQGGTHTVAPDRVLAMRPAFGASEAGAATTLLIGPGRLLSADPPEVVVAKLSDELDLAPLTTPNGLAFHANTARFSRAVPSTQNDPDAANAVVFLAHDTGEVRQAVQETPAEIDALLA